MYVFLRLGVRWLFVRAAGLGLGIWLLGGLVADAATVSDITDRAIVAGGTTGPINFTLSNFDPKQTIRTVAANITSGNGQAYEAEGTRILQGLQPDVVMIQEFNVNNSSSTDLRNWVTSTFGSEFSYFRENYNGIPNGVISRWPIVSSGSWDDTTISDRGFAWARINIPGEKNLWVVSVHLKTSSGEASQRQSQARQLVTYIQANVPADDYLLLGGDFNTYSTSESCLTTLSALLTTAGPYPVDQAGDADTNASRGEQYDWVLAESELDGLETPVKIGTLSFANGLVFDSRKFTPLSSVDPVLLGDSGASNMQHMAVVRAFAVPALELLTVTASSGNPTLVPNANIVVSGSGVSRTVTVTPAANQTGTATITVTGGDGVSTASDTFVVTVGTAPVITSTNNYSGTVGVAGTNYVTATGSVPMSYGASNLPLGLSIISSSGMISGTPTQAGVKQVVLTASNSYGSAIRTNAFVISKGTVGITAVPTASAITVGQALSVSVLSGGTASVAGAFAWTTPSTTPAVGTTSYGVTFTPTDTANYNTAATTVSVTVNKITSTISVAPTASVITVGQALSASVLSGGTASVAGAFAWTTPSTVPAVGTASYEVTFTPTDTANYSTAATTVSMTVNPAGSTFADWSGGAVLDSVGLSKYAIGGASSLTATDGVKPSSALADGFLVITAIVRTDNSSLTVVGQAVTDLANYVSGTGVTTVNGVETTDQAGVPTGHKRKTFSVAQGSDAKNFMRLSASLSLSGINTTVSVARDSGGATFLQVTGATAGATSGGTATSEKRTVYYFASDTTSTPTYKGGAWPYVIVQGQLSAGAEVTATLTKNSSGVLLVNGRPAYQYIGNSSSSTANAVSGTWPAMREDGTKTTIGPSGSLQ
jgi:endonuclease/exonuclease/phosphatase family metal-dependent hydrolase